MLKTLCFAPALVVLFLFSGVCWGAFGDVIEYFQLSTGWWQPISIAYGEDALWILNTYDNKLYKCDISGTELEIILSYEISDYASNDLNGLAYVVESSNKFLWTTSCLHRQLWQLDLSSQTLPRYRVIQLPVGYYPTSITLDNNLNIYFIDGISRKICKIGYSDYQDIQPYCSGTVSMIAVGNPLPAVPSIPMGIEYINEMPPKLYLTFAGENDYLMKTNINGIEITRKDLHQTQNPEFKSLMPTDLAVDSNGEIWFTDCDYDRLFKAYAQ
jgi:DNA-binding beta-propeller fold protein YncE